MLKVRLGSDDIFFPTVGELQVPAKGLVQPLGAFLLQHPLAVGRVADDDAAVGGQRHFGGVAVFEGDELADSGLPGVGHGQGDALGVVVGAKDAVFPPEFLVHSLGTNIPPQGLVGPGELLAGKATVQARGPVDGSQSGLNDDGAGAAERVPEIVPAPVPGQLNHGGG